VSIGITDNTNYIRLGQIDTYNVVVNNTGPSTDNAVKVNVALPAELVNASWTCSGANGVCASGSGGGSIQNALLNLAANASATFTITATVQPGPTDRINVTATATPSAGSTASATDATQVVTFRDGFDG
jgi:uncharacterized repeat protein (TIGR01451 family)